MSLRLRLTLWYSAVLTAVLIVFGLAVYGIISLLLFRQIDDSLGAVERKIQDASSVTALMNVRVLTVPLDEQLGASNVSAQVWDPNGNLLGQTEDLNRKGWSRALAPDALLNQEGGFSNVYYGNSHLRVHTVKLTTPRNEIVGYLQTAVNLRFADMAQSSLILVLVGGSVPAVMLAAFIGYFSASRALQPLKTITQTAEQITRADDLSRRIPLSDTQNDEVGGLIKAFNATLARLERLFNAQRRFMADVSHELRTPLTAIRGNVDLIRRMGQADPQSLEDIKSETERMTRLVGDLLLLAQADAGNLPLAHDLVELDTLLLEVGREARVIAGNVHLTVGEMDQAAVLGDRDRLKQVVLNLVTNAIKFTPEGGTVTLCLARAAGNWARLTVTDTGLGILPDELPKIFDRFYRVDKARSRAMGGAGLGLAIAQRITQMHGGRIEAASDGVGKGTTFAVWLPLAEKRAEPIDSAKTQPIKRSGLKLKAPKSEAVVTPPKAQ